VKKLEAFRVGGHLPSDEGLGHMILNAQGLGYDMVQTCLNGKGGYMPLPRDERWIINKFQQLAYNLNCGAHLPYTMNPCEPGAQRRAFYLRVFREHVEAADLLNMKWMVVHPGFKKKLSRDEAVANALMFFERVRPLLLQDQRVFIESDAGSKNGSAIGDMDTVGYLVDELGLEQFGMCVDTAHLYARGVDIWDSVIRESIEIEHREKIGLVHLNVPDAIVTYGGNLDRHNSPFESRSKWAHCELFEWLLTLHKPMVLERRSLAVQEADMKFISKWVATRS
jgi:endonuclease IV